jgi:hypothetical protein
MRGIIRKLISLSPRFARVIFLLTLCTGGQASAQIGGLDFLRFEPLETEKKHYLSADYGYYTLDANTDLSDFGFINVEYMYRAFKKWAVNINQNFVLTTDGDLESIVDGNDFSLRYCIRNCFIQSHFVGPVQITVFDHFGFDIGMGFARKNAQLSSAVLTYSGLVTDARVYYHLTPVFSAYGRASYYSLSKSSQELNITAFTAGVRLNF